MLCGGLAGGGPPPADLLGMLGLCIWTGFIGGWPGSWMVVAETLGLHQRRVEHSAAWYSGSQVALLVQAVAESPDAWTSAVDHSHAEEQLEACVR